MSSNQILCHCSAILLITGNHIYLQAFYSAILLFTGIISFTGILLSLIAESVSVLLGAGPILYYTLLVLVHNSLVVEDVDAMISVT